MKSNNIKEGDLGEKVLAGTKLALKKLVEIRAAEGKSLVVKINGVVKRVPARELLNNFPD